MNIVQPKVVSTILPAATVVENEAQKILIVGQSESGAIVSGGALYENVPANQEGALFGEASMLSQMVRAIRAVNKVTRIDAIALDDNGSAASAEFDVTFTGTATATGELKVAIGSADTEYTLVIAETDDATDAGDALVAAITADATSSVTAVNAVGVVTCTVKQGGTLGNTTGVSVSGAVAGITVALTAANGGAGDPDTANIFAVVGSNRYQGIVWPYFNDTDDLTDFLEPRWNAGNAILDGVGFTASVDVDAATTVARASAQNLLTLVNFADKVINEATFKASSMFVQPWVKSAMFAGVRALRLSDGEPISAYVVATNGARDAFGGPALASKPYFNTPLPALPVVLTGRGWTDLEIEQLFNAGASVIGNNPTGTGVLVGEVVTTYKTDPQSNPDVSFKFLNYVDTMSNVREYFWRNLRKRYAQSRLTEGDVIGGRDMANGAMIAATCISLYSDLSEDDYVLVQAGETALVYFKNNLTVIIDMAKGRATITCKVPIVTQLREILQTLQVSFSTEG